MEHSFWMDRWRAGEIGFHQGQPNAFLARFGERLGASKRVLVPLCGKAEDLAWLAAQGHQVVGVELVEDAVRAFFDEHAITPVVDTAGPLRRFSKDNITVLVGDFFQVTAEHAPGLNAFYDRAAMVALPPDLRARYVTHLRSLLPTAATGLLIAFEYPQALMDGPPFSVPESEVRTHYASAKVELLATAPVEGGRLGALGDQVTERCYQITI